MLKGIIPALYGNKSGRKRALDPIGGAAVGASAAVSAGIKIKHMLPGKILKMLDAERFEFIQLFIGDPIPHRFYSASLKTHEKNIKNGDNHMEVLAQGQETQEKEKSDVMHKIGN